MMPHARARDDRRDSGDDRRTGLRDQRSDVSDLPRWAAQLRRVLAAVGEEEDAVVYVEPYPRAPQPSDDGPSRLHFRCTSKRTGELTAHFGCVLVGIKACE
jgi:hypothetical protein